MTDRTSSVDAAFAASVSEDAAPRLAVAPGPLDSVLGDSVAGDSVPGSDALYITANVPPSLPVGAPLAKAVAVPTAADSPPTPINADDEQEESAWDDWTRHLPSWMTSMVVHLVLVLILATATTLTVVRDGAPSLVVSSGSQGHDEGPPEELAADLMAKSDELEKIEQIEALSELPPTEADTQSMLTNLPMLPTGELQAAGADAGADQLLATAGGNSLEGRLNGALRGSLVRSGGGTPESEEAVTLALKWLAAHQEYNGSWSFQHQTHPKCNGACENPGYTPGRIASTSLALLPFLGTGQTHMQGDYKRTIDMGLKFLVGAISHEGKLGSLWDPHGTMYGHGLASIALCEAYGMTHDPALREPAQSVVNFIVEAQDPQGGGWRYQARKPGDTSVVGWQLMALKSAQMAYLRVPQDTLRKTGYFLDSVQGQGGAVYGYQGPDVQRPTTSAIGLLCRMYLGWGRDVRPLEQGVQVLGTLGPSTDRSGMRNNMYYNYYATQVMHHWGGNPWQRWNTVMREYLVRSQARNGHELGSWFFDGADPGSTAGGRLYCTALAAMTLEVYYRHMPLYREQSVGD